MEKKLYLVAIGVLLVFAIVVMVVIQSFASLNGEIEMENSLKETDRNAYYASLASDLKWSFPKVLVNTESGEKEVIAYPPEYGGAYIDTSNTLHILLTKTANMITKSSYLEIMSNDKDIIFDTADFPLSHLVEVQRALEEVMLEFNIESVILNDPTNRLDLHLLDSTKKTQITEFLENKFNNFDARCITFNDPLGIKPSGTDLYGNALAGSNCSTSTQLGTLGFNAYRHATGTQGVVTAAHIATDGTSVLNARGTTIGSETARQFSGTIDAAFVPLAMGMTFSYEISGFTSPDDRITHYYPNANITYGEPVDKRGRSSGTTSGTIVSTNSMFTVQGITFTDQVRVTNTQLGGEIAEVLSFVRMLNQVQISTF